MNLKHILLFLVVFFAAARADKADMLIFSFDRPIQLYAYLESIEKFIVELGKVSIIYRSSSAEYNMAYEECFTRFAALDITPYKQGSNPREDFKPLVLQWLDTVTTPAVLFGVDDIIVKDHVNIAECIEYMRIANAHGFYLRLGKNITQCYTEGIAVNVPESREIEPGVFAFTFAGNAGDWGYPSSVDMTIFFTDEVKDLIPQLYFDNPNHFEGAWAVRSLGLLGWSPRDMHKTGLYFEQSKMVNIPFNLVQTDHRDARNMGYPVELFLEKFNQGLKLDISVCYQIDNKAPHMEMEPTFIKR